MTTATETELTAALREEQAAKEAALERVAVEIDAIDERRAKKIIERDRLIQELGVPPFLVATRRLGALGRMTHQNAAYILNRRQPPAA